MIFLSAFLSERDFVRDFETKNWTYLGVFFHQKDKKKTIPDTLFRCSETV